MPGYNREKAVKLCTSWPVETAEVIAMLGEAIQRIDALESTFEYRNPGWEAVYRLAKDEITMRKCLELLRGDD